MRVRSAAERRAAARPRALTAASGLALGLVLAPAAGPLAAPAWAAGPATRRVVDGLPLYVQPGNRDGVLLRAYVRAGRSAAPVGRAAVADLTAAWMAAGGTQSLPGADFAKALRAIGAELRATAGPALLELEMTVPPASVRPAARLFADLLMYPAFDPGAEDAARKLTARTAAGEDALFATARDWLRGREGEPPVVEAPLGSVRREEVLRFHRERVGIDTTVVVLEGMVDDVEVDREIGGAFLAFRRAARPVAFAGDAPSVHVATAADRGDAEGRARLVVALSGLPRSHPDWMPLEVALLAIAVEEALAPLPGGGPLETRLRIEQPLLEGDLVLLDFKLPRDLLDAALARHARAAEMLVAGRIGAPALERAKGELVFALVPLPEAPHAAEAHARLEALGVPGESPSARVERVQALDRASAASALRSHLR